MFINQDRSHSNQYILFLAIRNKYVCPLVNIHASLFVTLGKDFLHPVGCGSVFFGKTLLMCLKKRYSVDEVDMVDKAKLHSTHCGRGDRPIGRDRGSGSLLWDFCLLSNVRSYTLKVSSTGLPKHELNKNGINGHAKVDRKEAMRLRNYTIGNWGNMERESGSPQGEHSSWLSNTEWP